MSDNEKLIEDAAKAIAAFTDPAAWTQFRGEAGAALAVFEKAHTPTDDEREAMIEDRKAVLEVLNQGRSLPLDVVSAQIVMVLADRGFRRTEVPEPSRDPGWSHPEAVYSPEVFMAIQGLLNEARGEPMHALRLAVSRQVSEPQGEPSDARRAPVQASRGADAGPAGSISWAEHVEVWQVYAQKHGTHQSAERIAERGGFGYGEIVLFTGHPPRTFEPVKQEGAEQ